MLLTQCACVCRTEATVRSNERRIDKAHKHHEHYIMDGVSSYLLACIKIIVMAPLKTVLNASAAQIQIKFHIKYIIYIGFICVPSSSLHGSPIYNSNQASYNLICNLWNVTLRFMLFAINCRQPFTSPPSISVGRFYNANFQWPTIVQHTTAYLLQVIAFAGANFATPSPAKCHSGSRLHDG